MVYLCWFSLESAQKNESITNTKHPVMNSEGVHYIGSLQHKTQNIKLAPLSFFLRPFPPQVPVAQTQWRSGWPRGGLWGSSCTFGVSLAVWTTSLSPALGRTVLLMQGCKTTASYRRWCVVRTSPSPSPRPTRPAPASPRKRRTLRHVSAYIYRTSTSTLLYLLLLRASV